MDKSSKDSNFCDAGIQSRKRGFNLPIIPMTSDVSMSPVNPPKEQESNEEKKKEQIKGMEGDKRYSNFFIKRNKR